MAESGYTRRRGRSNPRASSPKTGSGTCRAGSVLPTPLGQFFKPVRASTARHALTLSVRPCYAITRALQGIYIPFQQLNLMRTPAADFLGEGKSLIPVTVVDHRRIELPF